MSTSTLSQHGIDRDALLRIVDPVVHAHGAEVVDISVPLHAKGPHIWNVIAVEGATVGLGARVGLDETLPTGPALVGPTLVGVEAGVSAAAVWLSGRSVAAGKVAV